MTWGHSSSGGDSTAVSTSLNSGVTKVFSTYSVFGGAFAALKGDGPVVPLGGIVDMEEIPLAFLLFWREESLRFSHPVMTLRP